MELVVQPLRGEEPALLGHPLLQPHMRLDLESHRDRTPSGHGCGRKNGTPTAGRYDDACPPAMLVPDADDRTQSLATSRMSTRASGIRSCSRASSFKTRTSAAV